jgi:hypothetical protein
VGRELELLVGRLKASANEGAQRLDCIIASMRCLSARGRCEIDVAGRWEGAKHQQSRWFANERTPNFRVRALTNTEIGSTETP